MKKYGILYTKIKFPKGHKLEWLNYSFSHMTKSISIDVKKLIQSLNSKYSDKILIPLDENLNPGLVCEASVIKEISNELYEGFNEILGGEFTILVWTIGQLDKKETILTQGKRIKDIPTLHHLDSYPVIVKVGGKLDSIKTPGIYKV